MSAMAIITVAAALGVDVGWRPGDAGLEYIIQIEPQLVGSLVGGETIASDVPPALRPLASLRVGVGRGVLPRQTPEGRGDSTAGASKRGARVMSAAPPTGADVGWQPAEGGGLEYLIQFDPDTVSALGKGETLVFDLRGAPGEVSSFRITVGSATLPQVAPAAEHGTEAIAADKIQRADETRPAGESQAADETHPADDAQPASEPQPADESRLADEPRPADAVRAANESSRAASDSAERPAKEPAEPTIVDPAAAAMRQQGVVDPSEPDKAPALSDSDALQLEAAVATDDEARPRETLRPMEKPPGRFVPDKQRQLFAAHGDDGDGEGVRDRAAFASTGSTAGSGAKESDRAGSNASESATPSPSAAETPGSLGEGTEPAWPRTATGAMLGFFGSLGANVYLVWLFFGLRRRYRALLEKMSLKTAA